MKIDARIGDDIEFTENRGIHTMKFRQRQYWNVPIFMFAVSTGDPKGFKMMTEKLRHDGTTVKDLGKIILKADAHEFAHYITGGLDYWDESGNDNGEIKFPDTYDEVGNISRGMEREIRNRIFDGPRWYGFDDFYLAFSDRIAEIMESEVKKLETMDGLGRMFKNIKRRTDKLEKKARHMRSNAAILEAMDDIVDDDVERISR